MRFKINLGITGHNKFLPIDYQYALAAAIYKLISKGDEAYSQFLHDGGYSPGGLKRFKLFSFGSLSLPRYTPWKDRSIFELHGDTISFTISFIADKAAEAFVKGMFQDQHLSIGDRFSVISCEVTSVEAITPPFFTRNMRYRCISPMMIEDKKPTEKYGKYLAPNDPQFGELLLQNLISKCAALNILHHDKAHENEQLNFTLTSDFRSKLITIKPYTAEQTKVRGYLFDFTLTAPEYMQEVGYYAGFGMGNGMGFGGVAYI
jgi:CRISPR-associated endoribonuclease Cas6